MYNVDRTTLHYAELLTLHSTLPFRSCRQERNGGTKEESNTCIIPRPSCPVAGAPVQELSGVQDSINPFGNPSTGACMDLLTLG